MKKILLAIIVVATAFMSAKSQTYSFSHSYDKGAYLIDFSLDGYTITDKNTPQGTFVSINIGNSTCTEKKGWPEIPFASYTINIGDGKPTVSIEYTHFRDTVLSSPLLPSRGTIFRNENPDQLPYSIDSESLTDNFFPEKIFNTEDPFVFGNKRQANIRIFPFQYNGATRTLRIYDSISIKVETNITRTQSLASYDYGDILVLAPEKYDSAIAPYITWKREMGFNVNLIHCDSAENVSSKIAQAYVQNPNILYVQIVGNWNDIRSNTLGSETCYDCPTDPALGCVAGNDDYPDIAIGRFSCSNEEELSVQIQKCINYEKNPNNNRDWREKFIGIGSNEGPGDDDELDYQHVMKIYDSKLSEFTYNTHSQHYDAGTNVSSNLLSSSIDLGASSIAYCGHGSGSYWLTGGYGSASVTSSSNGDKLPFVVSVACRNGAFHSSDCFAEKWLNARHGGAVATLMSSIDQPWNPPMRGQDYFYDILTGGYNYENDSAASGLSTNQQRTRWGSIVINAFYLMLCESAQTSDLETVKSWTTFGDASLQLRTKTPDKIESSNCVANEGSVFTTQITTDNQGVKNALVCLSQNGNYYKGFTNSRGNVTIGHDLTEGKALLVVTAFNTTTIYDSIPVIGQGQPYIEITNYSPLSAGAGTSTNLSLSLQNLGSVQSDSIKVRISSDDEYLTITNDSAAYLPLLPGGSEENNSLSVQIADSTPYGHIFDITAIVQYNGSSTERHLYISQTGQECYAPDSLSAEYAGDSCILSWNGNTIKQYTIFDDFEDREAYPSFAINPEGNAGWTYIDGDDSNTGSITGYTFPNNREKMAFVAFNPHLAYADNDSSFYSQIHPYSGQQFLASFRSSTQTTDDWIFSRELDFCSDFEFSFHVRGSHISSYWETMEVYYTIGDSLVRIDSCTIHGSANPDEWTLKTYQIPDSASKVAIRNVSRNKNFLCIDDIRISGQKSYSTGAVNIYDNGELSMEEVDGSSILLTNLENGEHCLSIRPTCDINLYADTSICFSIYNEPCDAPTNAICYQMTATDSIVWHSVQNAIAYNIYESGILIGSTSDTTFVSGTIIPEGNYYTLSSVCSNGESEQIEVQTILVGNNEIPCNAARIYPNPSNGQLTIEYLSNNQTGEYTISNICGKNIAGGKLSFGLNELNLQAFPNGMYIISISSGDTTYKQKIIKQ